MKKILTFLMSTLLICGCSSSERYTDNGMPLPIKGHPRVMLNAESLERLKAKYNNPELKEVREDLKKEAQAVDCGKVTDGDPKQKIWQAYEASAFLYLVEGDKEAGLKAKKLVLELLPSIAPDMEYGKNEMPLFQSRRTSDAIFAAAMVYDWCHDLFTEAEKQQVIREVDRLAGLMEVRELGPWPHQADSMKLYEFTNPHWAEMKHPHLLAFGIASYDENPDLYLNMADHLYNHFVPMRNCLYKSTSHHHGSAYGPGRFEAEILSGVLISRMGYENPYDRLQGTIPMRFLYMERPDGHRMIEGDDFNIFRAPDFYHGGYKGLILTANEYDNPYYQDIVLRNWDKMKKYKFYDPTFLFLAYDDRLAAQSIDQLPLSRYFASPRSSMIARTGWDLTGGPQSETALVKMDIHDYNLGGHVHSDAGNFSIYYKGPLAIDSGAYAASPEGKKFGGRHFKNYYIKAVAHNTLLVCDEDNPSGEQKEKNARFNSFEEMEKIGKRGEVLGHAFGPDEVNPDFTWLKGNLAEAYDPSVRQMDRSFVFLNMKQEKTPGYLLVRDYFKGEKPATVKWLLHSEQEPSLKGESIVINKDSGRMDYDGQLIAQTIFPAAEVLYHEKIGGPGKEFWSEGKNWPIKDEEQIDSMEAGRWRVEISNKTPEREWDHLALIHIRTASDQNAPATATAIGGEKTIGVRIGDRAVLFSRDSHPIGTSFNVEIPGNEGEKCKILLTDLAEGKWEIMGSVHEVKAGEGCIYLESKPGKFEILKQ